MLVVKQTDNGTYAIFRNGRPVILGLTRWQAEEFASTTQLPILT